MSDTRHPRAPRQPGPPPGGAFVFGLALSRRHAAAVRRPAALAGLPFAVPLRHHHARHAPPAAVRAAMPWRHAAPWAPIGLGTRTAATGSDPIGTTPAPDRRGPDGSPTTKPAPVDPPTPPSLPERRPTTPPRPAGRAAPGVSPDDAGDPHGAGQRLHPADDLAPKRPPAHRATNTGTATDADPDTPGGTDAVAGTDRGAGPTAGEAAAAGPGDSAPSEGARTPRPRPSASPVLLLRLPGRRPALRIPGLGLWTGLAAGGSTRPGGDAPMGAARPADRLAWPAVPRSPIGPTSTDRPPGGRARGDADPAGVDVEDTPEAAPGPFAPGRVRGFAVVAHTLTRVVEREVAAAERRSRGAEREQNRDRSEPDRSVTLSDVTSDRVVRVLLEKIRALDRAERFRVGRPQ